MSLTRLKPDTDPAATRAQLLEAAGAVFAEAGYRAATVREICQRAGANIAAVNYHFGDKQALYAEVLKTSYRLSVAKYPPDLGLAPGAGAEERLAAFVRSFLLRIFSSGPEARHGKLMARELIEPTAVLDEVVRETIQPMATTLMAIVKDLLGPGTPPESIRRHGMSVVSQVLFYHHCRPVITRMFPDLQFNAEGIDRLADHITRFSLAAMRATAVATPAASKRAQPAKKAKP
jgi:AcrR family transcriptional regulator